MSPAFDEFLCSWPFEPWAVAAAAACAAVYLRGWRSLRRAGPARWRRRQPAAFLAGLACVLLALASPIEVYATRLLAVHMVQHLLLMMAAPPLLWLGEPLFPLLRGLPASAVSCWAAPLLRSPRLGRLFEALSHPVGAGAVFVATTWLWHAPALYELALRSEGWHYVQHGCFLAAALLFWYPVVRPYPARPGWSPWLLLPYLLLADVQNTALAALLTFAARPWYAGYALDDQATAGVLMWVPGSLAYLLPLLAVGLRLMGGQTGPVMATTPPPPRRRVALPLLAAAPPRFDVLRLPLLGRLLRWRHARLAFQLPMLLLAALVIHDGLTGPRTTPLNLAGVLPWVHWRGLVVLGLLVAGNVFCFGCPFLLPRTLARRLLPARWAWPRRLRGKWPALVLLVVFLWAYEALALWDSPWWTAWIALGYFAAALAIDGLFRGAAFCQHVCPIGQFNFVGSLASPLEVRALDPAVCAACQTKDCLRGRDGVPGCELGLYLPRKQGNMDCTACLDCAHACPHGNVGVVAAGAGLGRFGRRPDVAALVVVLTFGAFANAAGMVAPVVAWQERLTAWAGWRSPVVVVTVFYLVTLLFLPLLLIGAAAAVSRCWGRLGLTAGAAATRFAFALAPLGFAMWLAHYGFHLVTSYDAVMPAARRWLGWGELASADCCATEVPAWLHELELLALFVGLLASWHAARRIAREVAPGEDAAWRAWAPWAALAAALFAAGAWVALQPMQMRGTMQMAG